jgi:hypothetical protein
VQSIAPSLPLKRLQAAYFLWGILLLAALIVFDYRSSKISEDVIAFIALACYGSYILGSALMSVTIWGTARTWWILAYLGALAPYILLISWSPISSSWTGALHISSDHAAQLAAIGSNTILATITAALLLWLRDLSFVALRAPWIPIVCAVAVPMSLWVAQVALVLSIHSY